jgi:hypothetical protein
MTLSIQSGNMSQLYNSFTWISMVATLTDATVVASIFTNLTPLRDILQAFNTYFFD